ncbi:MAG: thioredoxin family protein [Chitinophagaceae bacterium]|nr:thioredoxin family protein [Chitinophagaceae bacterium]
MKRFVNGLLFLLFPVLAFTQSQPLQWQVKADKINDSSYNLSAQITIQPNWHVYAETDADIGIDALQLTWDNENIIPDGNPVVSAAKTIISDPLFDNKKMPVYPSGQISLTQKIIVRGTAPVTLKTGLKGFASSNLEFVPIDEPWQAVFFEGGVEQSSKDKIKLTAVDLKNPVQPCGDAHAGDKHIWIVFLLGLGGGFIALLTPCVFPMIPVTVSFFTNRAPGKSRAVKNGILYGFFIFLIYVLASLPFHLIGNVQPEIFNNISTNAWLNIFFFIVFIIFAISFFGYFEITLPSGFAGKVDAKSGLGSASGIFFMALTLVIVSFSCTGVILGTLLVGTASDGAWSLTAGMAGFGTALALPFALFAIFPNWLKSLPKSGGWLDTVKKILAFVELALAFKFLSNADLVEHWGLLKREVFIGIWLLISLGLALYLFGWLRLPHDYKGQKISAGRKMLGGITFLFALYLVPGLSNTPYANLKLLSGFPPPLSYSLYHNDKGVEAVVINDYDKAVQLSKEQNKPLLIDFTGWACVNCRRMEEQVWTQPEISSIINENFILVSLYVDDRKKLPANERFTYKPANGNEKEIITVGDKWATFQSENFSQVTQPLYVILSPEEKLMTHPVGYTPDVKKYQDWLNCGLKAFGAK